MPGKKLQSKDTLAEHKKQPPFWKKVCFSVERRQTLAYVFSALVEHKKCKAHQDACRKLAAKTASTVEVSQSKAGKALHITKVNPKSKAFVTF